MEQEEEILQYLHFRSLRLPKKIKVVQQPTHFVTQPILYSLYFAQVLPKWVLVKGLRKA